MKFGRLHEDTKKEIYKIIMENPGLRPMELSFLITKRLAVCLSTRQITSLRAIVRRREKRI